MSRPDSASRTSTFVDCVDESIPVTSGMPPQRTRTARRERRFPELVAEAE
jgi:hypothetical protein